MSVFPDNSLSYHHLPQPGEDVENIKQTSYPAFRLTFRPTQFGVLTQNAAALHARRRFAHTYNPHL